MPLNEFNWQEADLNAWSRTVIENTKKHSLVIIAANLKGKQCHAYSHMGKYYSWVGRRYSCFRIKSSTAVCSWLFQSVKKLTAKDCFIHLYRHCSLTVDQTLCSLPRHCIGWPSDVARIFARGVEVVRHKPGTIWSVSRLIKTCHYLLHILLKLQGILSVQISRIIYNLRVKVISSNWPFWLQLWVSEHSGSNAHLS